MRGRGGGGGLSKTRPAWRDRKKTKKKGKSTSLKKEKFLASSCQLLDARPAPGNQDCEAEEWGQRLGWARALHARHTNKHTTHGLWLLPSIIWMCSSKADVRQRLGVAITISFMELPSSIFLERPLRDNQPSMATSWNFTNLGTPVLFTIKLRNKPVRLCYMELSMLQTPMELTLHGLSSQIPESETKRWIRRGTMIHLDVLTSRFFFTLIASVSRGGGPSAMPWWAMAWGPVKSALDSRHVGIMLYKVFSSSQSKLHRI